jgi:hypothetical protein
MAAKDGIDKRAATCDELKCHTRSPGAQTQPNIWAATSDRNNHWKKRRSLPPPISHIHRLNRWPCTSSPVPYLHVYHAQFTPENDPRPPKRYQAASKQAQNRVDDRPELLPPGKGARLGDRGVERRPQHP